MGFIYRDVTFQLPSKLWFFTSTAYIAEFENILAFTKPEIQAAKYCLKEFPTG